METSTSKPPSSFVQPDGRLNSILVHYFSHNNLKKLLKLAETLASRSKPKNRTLALPKSAEYVSK